MGAFKGSLSYKIFHVQGELEDDWKTRYVERIQANSFTPLMPEDEDEVSEGWVPIDRPLDTEFDLYSILFDHYINLGFRRDKYTIPKALLKAHVQEAERAYMRENDKTELSKFERDDIKATVERELKEQQLPKMRIIDVSWDIRNGRVRFWSQANKRCETFQQYFEDTFEVDVLPANPYIDAVEQDLDDHQLQRLQDVEPTNFVDVDEASVG